MPDSFRGPRSIYKAEPHSKRKVSLVGRLVRYSLLVILALVVGVGGFLVLAPPTDIIRDRVIAEVKAKTGRDLAVGSARLTLVPSLGVNLKNVTVSNPGDMPGAPLLTARGIEVNVALLPLITREVQIERLVLVEPVVNLRIDGSGRRNWDFADAEPLRRTDPVRYAQAAPPRGQEFRRLPPELQDFAKNASTPAKPGNGLGVSALSLGDVRIGEGRLRFEDQRSGLTRDVSGINVRLSLKDIGSPLTVRGSLVYKREPLEIDVGLEAPREFIEDRPSRITAQVDGPVAKASYDGVITRSAGPVDGRMSVKTASMAQLARWLDVPIAGLDALGALGVEGQIKVGPSSFAISNATLALGELSASGMLSVELAGGRPQIKTNLKIAHLDIDALSALGAGVPPQAPAPDSRPTTPVPPKPGPEAPAVAPRSIEDLLKADEAGPARPGTAVRGFLRREGWSQDPINLAVLQLVDLDGRFSIGRVTWQQIKTGQTQLAVDLKGGVLKSQIQEIELYGGRGRGIITLDARQHEGILGVNLSADAVTIGPLLKDAAAVDILEGRGRVLIAVNGRGASEREIVGTLAGKAEIFLNDGTIVGWDAGQLIGDLGQLKVPSFDRRPGARTPYSQLSSTFQIANGVGRTQDLRFESAPVKATGTGVVNLVDRNLNLLLKARAASGNLANVDVPVRIAGNFDAINVVPEVKGSEQLKQLGQRVRETDIDNAARSLLGDTPEAEKGAAKAKELLRRFIRP